MSQNLERTGTIDGEKRKDEVLKKLFSPFKIGGLNLKNRLIRAGCFEGMIKLNQVTDQLIAFHEKLILGGLAMTTLAYSAVSADGRAFQEEIYVCNDNFESLKKMCRRIHSLKDKTTGKNLDGKVSIQLSHCGFFSAPSVINKKTMGPSPKFCWFRMSRCRQMTEKDITEKVNDFVNAALLCKRAGFDAIELHCGHGYLLSQFLSTFTNKRKDEYGGSIENRCRMPARVVREVRKAVGKNYPIFVKVNQDDLLGCNGLTLKDAIAVCQILEKSGCSAIIPSCGFTSSRGALNMMRGGTPTEQMAENHTGIYSWFLRVFGKLFIKTLPFKSVFLLNGSSKIQKAVRIPVCYIGGVDSLQDISKCFENGMDLLQIGRWGINDPCFANKLRDKKIEKSDCFKCNACIASFERDHGLLCYAKEYHDDWLRKKREKRKFREKLPLMVIFFVLALVFGIILFLRF